MAEMRTERTDIDVATTPKEADKSLGQLFGELTQNMGELFRKEVELAKVETKEEVTKAGKAGGMLGAAGVVGYLALILLSFALAWLLDEVMPTPLAFFIVGLVWAIVAGVLYVEGRKRLKQVQPVPQQTVETLKEDVEWAKTQRS